MNNYCAFSKDHKCLIWEDYEITRYELEEANLLCQENWIEIQRQYEYIQELEKTLSQNGIETPDEEELI